MNLKTIALLVCFFSDVCKLMKCLLMLIEKFMVLFDIH